MKNGFTDYVGHQKKSPSWIVTEAEKPDLTEKPENVSVTWSFAVVIVL